MSRGRSVTARRMARRCHVGSPCMGVVMSAPRRDADGAPEETPDGDPPAPHALRVTVATDQTGAPLPRLSTLAAHTRAVMADPRAALLGIVPTSRAVNPQEDDRGTH